MGTMDLSERFCLRIFILLMLLAILLMPGSAVPSEQWNKTFGENAEDWFNSVQQTSDGGYIIAGQYSFPNPKWASNPDAWLIKFDSNGNQQWDKKFGGSENDWATSVLQTSDGGYIFAGATGSFRSNSDSNAWLVKVDVNGTQQWYRTFGGEKDDSSNSIRQTKDGGYIIAGMYSYGENTNSWLIKTDASGNKLWDRTFGGDLQANSALQTRDGGYIFTGKTRIYTSTGNYINAVLIKTDADGNPVWRKTYGGKKDDIMYSVQQTEDGGYILAGSVRSTGNGSADAWLIKTDVNGSQLWEKTFGGTGDDRADSVRQISDGGYILAGRTEQSDGTGKSDVLLIRTDANGTQLWSKTFGGINSDWASSVQPAVDGSYILTGATYSYGNGSADAWLIKVSGETNYTQIATPLPTPTPAASTPASTPTPLPAQKLSQTTPEPVTAIATVKTKMPGFSAMLAIAGILAIVNLIRRNN